MKKPKMNAVAAEKTLPKELVVRDIERHLRDDIWELQDLVDYMLELPESLLQDVDVWVVALQAEYLKIKFFSDCLSLRVHPLIKKLYNLIPGHLLKKGKRLGFVTAVIRASKGFCVFVDMENRNAFKKCVSRVPACFIAWLQASGSIAYEAWVNDWIRGEHFNRGNKWAHEAVFQAVQALEKDQKYLYKGGFVFDMMHPLCFDTAEKMADAVTTSYRAWRTRDSAANDKGTVLSNMLKRDFPHFYHDYAFVSLLMRRYGIATYAERDEFANNFPRHMHYTLLNA